MIPSFIQDMELSKYNVLAVDDIPLNLLLVQKMLSKFNFRIRTATNGREALEAVAQDKPHLILLDLMMPEIDGYEVLRRLKADPETADIRVIILSALNSNEDIVKGFDLGANDFLTKPISMEKLLNVVATQFKLIQSGIK
jgi:CheY-like chemotaxis protein